MRFKPPPPNSPIGWRVEFRPCEAQLTDFENAAIVCFVVLLTRVILSYQLDFLIPISKVDENMQTSQKRGAVLTEKFWFKKNINGAKDQPNNHNEQSNGLDGDEYELMTIDQIINGKGCFPGLVPLINSYLGSMDVDADTHCTIQQYLKLIQKRASGELLTTASWIRKEITEHEEYKHDSVVSERICYDLLKKAKDIQDGIRPCPELLGANVGSKTADNIPPAIEKHLTKHC